MKPPCEHKNTTKKWDSKQHWDECDDCHQKLNVTKHTRGARQKDDKNHWYACKGCEYHMSEKAHKAQYTKYNDTNHWKECSCGCSENAKSEKHICGTRNTKPIPKRNDLKQIEFSLGQRN